jgi:hypothetical protein
VREGGDVAHMSVAPLTAAQRIKRFWRYYWPALISGVFSASFGWGAAAGAIIAAWALTFDSARQWAAGWGLTVDSAHQWVGPLLGAATGIVLASVVHVVIIAPFRALRMIRPFSATMVSGHLPSPYPVQAFEPQKVAIRIKNRAYLPRSCVVHVMWVEGFDNVNRSFPRFIEERSIEPGFTTDVAVMNWTFRNPPQRSDPDIRFCGPIGWGGGGNMASVPASGSHTITVRAAVEDGSLFKYGSGLESKVRQW